MIVKTVQKHFFLTILSFGFWWRVFALAIWYIDNGKVVKSRNKEQYTFHAYNRANLIHSTDIEVMILEGNMKFH